MLTGVAVARVMAAAVLQAVLNVTGVDIPGGPAVSGAGELG